MDALLDLGLLALALVCMVVALKRPPRSSGGLLWRGVFVVAVLIVVSLRAATMWL